MLACYPLRMEPPVKRSSPGDAGKSTVLLAVDLGLSTGLALYGKDGRLIWYRSHNFGTATRLRRGVQTILGDLPELKWLVMEGGGNLALIWRREAERQAISVMQVAAETWRQRLLLPREQRNGR